MGNFYKLAKYFTKMESPFLKLLGIYFLHITGRRCISVYLDPIMACNYRCRMCYFSDDGARSGISGKMTDGQYAQIADALFHRAIKLQIGCGAEPTLYKDLEGLIKKAKSKGVPYVSLTTNGALLQEESLIRYINAGLNEVTLSLHGTDRKTYEYFMVHGNFDCFQSVLHMLGRVKRRFPSFKVRVNYTMNADNVDGLSNMAELLKNVHIDVLQLRPIQRISEKSQYENYDLTHIEEVYDSVIEPLVSYCREEHIVCLFPEKRHLKVLENEERNKKAGIITDLLYCYISPSVCWKDDFDYETDTFESYCKRSGRSRQILGLLFKKSQSGENAGERTKKMNYRIK